VRDLLAPARRLVAQAGGATRDGVGDAATAAGSSSSRSCSRSTTPTARPWARWGRTSSTRSRSANPRFALLATAFTGAAVSFLMLVGSRIVLAAIAAARPAIASITGDAFRRTAQARVLSVIDAGELVITRAYGIGRSAAGVSLLAVGLVGCG
jgi:hypothetical protein